MSKLNRIDKKRRFYSFLIYILTAVWLLCGCAAKSSVEMDTAEAELQSPAADMTADNSSQAEPEAKSAADAVVSNDEEKIADTAVSNDEVKEKEYTESEPRIFFKPSDTSLGQVLGIDFTPIPQGKSRLTVTTSKEITYDLDRINRNEFALNIYDSKIANDVLLRYIDTSEFQNAVEKITPVFDDASNKVTLDIVMREVIPYYIRQSDDRLVIDFDRIKTKIPEKKIIPLNLVEAETQNLAAVKENRTGAVSGTSGAQGQSRPEIQAFSPSMGSKYTGEKLGRLEFVDADVTNILRMINDVSGENIIWDDAIKGKKVNMVLDDVPWDQALELILKSNDLAKRYLGENIIWITTKQKMLQILAEEEAEAKKLEQKLEQERLKLVEQQKRIEDDSPLITEYIPVDFAKAEEIKEHIIISKRGKLTVEVNTNTIIMTDTEKSIEEAKKIISKFDVPVKQIMIEARIVDATENFSRDLGLKWNSDTSFWKVNTPTDYTVPADAVDFEVGGQRAAGGSFSTNSPEGWSSNIGLNFAKASGSGMGRLTLDASLALAESEGTAKVMSAPKVTAREGSSATISSGDKIIIPAAENVQSTTLDATLSLTVTPVSVSYNDYITLEVDVTDDQAPSETRILKKSINTTLMVKSGETVVIGGIIKESEGDDVTGIPILKDAPVLGWLFKSKRKTHSKSELLIFLTPTVQPAPIKHY